VGLGTSLPLHHSPVHKALAGPVSTLARHRRTRLALSVPAATALGSLAQGGLWLRHPLLTVVNIPVTATFVATGVLLLEDSRQRGTAWALILAGITRPLGWLNQWNIGPFPLYSVVFGYLANIFGAWALLRYPEQRLAATHRRFVQVAAGFLILGPALLTCVSEPDWWDGLATTSWWTGWWPHRALFQVSSVVFDVGAMLLAVAFLVLLPGRLRSGRHTDRAALLPVVCAGVLAGIAAGGVMTVAAVSHPYDELYSIEGMAQLAIPVAFLVSIEQRRLSQVTNLIAQFDGRDPTGDLLRGVLRVHLRDPDLDVLVWSPVHGAYTTVDGHPIELDQHTEGGLIEPVTGRDDTPLALLVTRRSPPPGRALLTTAVVMTRLALQNETLSKRILTAEYDGRQRVAADLHDGAQKDLCALLIALSAAHRTARGETRGQIERAQARANEALSELRDLAHGLYSQTLSHAGLCAAVEETADHLDLLADITIPGHRLPDAIEKTLYFVTCEALTNVAKHANAELVRVTVEVHDGAALVQVVDDGKGGADPWGAGLAGLRDRVQAFGGDLSVDSIPGQGTTLVARIPCG
jgi:signal transduction histidine kinase